MDLQSELSSPSISSEECIDMLLSVCETEDKQLFRGTELGIIFRNYQLDHRFLKSASWLRVYPSLSEKSVSNCPKQRHALAPAPCLPLCFVSELLARFGTRVRHGNLDMG